MGLLLVALARSARSGGVSIAPDPLTSDTEKKTEEAPEDAGERCADSGASRERAILSSATVRAQRAQAAALLQLD